MATDTLPDMTPTPVKGWDTTLSAPPTPDPMTGWWAALDIDDAITIQFVTSVELQALKKLGFVLAVNVNRSAVLRAVRTMALNRGLTATMDLGLLGIYFLNLNRTIDVNRAAALVTVKNISAARALNVNRSAELGKVLELGALNGLWTVNRSAGLTRIVPTNHSLVVSVDRALSMIPTRMMAVTRSLSFNASAQMGFRPYAGASQIITATGAYTYTIPRTAYFIDLVMVGAGGGGSSGNVAISNGMGGEAGQWFTAILVRGEDIPWAATTITGSVPGAPGGGGGGWVPLNGNPGGNTTAAANVGGWSAAALGGAGGNWNVNSGRAGKGPGTINFNGFPYVGGNNTSDSAANGNAPGGGGGGGNAGAGFFPAGGGGSGSRGQVWFRAYQ